MRISFSVDLSPESGKQNFAIRLASAMREQNVRVTNRRPDVNLVFVDGVRDKCKNIFRLDGILMNTKINYTKKNKAIKSRIKQCDGLIYQNQFCKAAADKFLGKFKKHAIIFNGAKFPENTSAFHHRKPYVLAVSRWRGHKRLRITIDSFLNSSLEKDFDLIVLGDPDYTVKHNSVVFKGRVKADTVWSYILGSRFVVHLAYVDWCPNSVVESLICGKNVLHSSCGGTKYIVQNNGIMISDKEWNFEPIDLYNPPTLDLEELSNAYSKMLDLPPAMADYLDINTIAKQYIDYCQKVLNATN